MATNFTEKEHILLANKSFSSGKIYFEFIAPADCCGMQMGIMDASCNPRHIVVKDNKNLLLEQFRTTTPRTIGIQIDFDELKLRFWLNEIYQFSREKSIKKDVSYIPCVIFTLPRN